MTAVDRCPVSDFTFLSGAIGETDPFKAYEDVGSVPPFWTESPNDIDGFWVATRYEDIRAILRDSSVFSSVNALIPHVELAHPMLPSESDPPELNKYRGILLPHLTANKVDPLEDRMHEVCAELVDSFKSSGRCDAVADFARIYPITIFTELFGLPVERREEFRTLAHRFLDVVPERPATWAKIRAIVEGQLEEKRLDPQEDLLSAIGNGRIDNELISMEDATNMASTVFVGGLDTLPSNIAWTLRHLATHPEQRAQIVSDPDLIPDAVEEFLRRFSVANPVRRATVDVEVGGSLIRANDRVLVLIANADRDPAEFGDADVVRFDRETNRHVAFGAGMHRCLGSHLARHELQVAMCEWHQRIPDYRIPADGKLTYRGGVLAMDSLPLEWDV